MVKKYLFLFVVLVLCIVAGFLLFHFSMTTVDAVHMEAESFFRHHLRFLAEKSTVLIRRSESSDLRKLITDYITEDSSIAYVFVETNGIPYADTFKTEFPMNLLVEEEIPRGQIRKRIVSIPGGEQCYDFATSLGYGDARIHIGVLVNRIDDFGWFSATVPYFALGVILVAAIALAIFRFFKVSSVAPLAKSKPAKVVSDGWSNIVELLPAGVFIVEPEMDRITYANRHASNMIRLPKGSIVGRDLGNFFGLPDELSLPLSELDDDPRSRRAYIITPSKDKLPVMHFRNHLLIDNVQQQVIVFVDISDLKDLEDRLRQAFLQQESLANYDKLTRLFNRRAIQKHAEAELNRAERGGVLTVLLMDIDHFKRVNDTHGHHAGDEVLKRVADVIRDNVRPYDWVGRWGGEEFLVILPGTPMITGATVADRIREATEGTNIHVTGVADIKVTISIGLSSTESTGGNTHMMKNLVNQADEALYHAKESGRNRVSLYRRGDLTIYSD